MVLAAEAAQAAMTRANALAISLEAIFPVIACPRSKTSCRVSTLSPPPAATRSRVWDVKRAALGIQGQPPNCTAIRRNPRLFKGDLLWLLLGHDLLVTLGQGVKLTAWIDRYLDTRWPGLGL